MSKRDFKTDPQRRRDREQEVTLTYLVEINTYGKPSQLRDKVGRRLAREVGLQFTSWDVVEIKTDEHYDWSPDMHNGGDAPTFAEDEADAIDDTMVQSVD